MPTHSDALRQDLLNAIPNLRAFAMSMTSNVDLADDLVQETLVKAWSNLASFEEGTNLKAWLFTILRNIFFSKYRKTRREVEDCDGFAAARLIAQPDQLSHMDFQDFRAALAELPNEQREALILIGAEGFSYDEAAAISGCAVGTIKSRVNRARTTLVKLLQIDSTSDFGSNYSFEVAASY